MPFFLTSVGRVGAVARQSRHLRAFSSTLPRRSNVPSSPASIDILGKSYKKDEWSNIPVEMLPRLSRRLHAQPGHPLYITRKLIESCFPSYRCFGVPRAGTESAAGHDQANYYSPVVSVAQNFDTLGFSADHPGRSRSDTYYVNSEHLLRTHTSAHQISSFSSIIQNAAADGPHSPGFLITGDVYRRDAIDRSHYPVFHQMEGAHIWSGLEPSAGPTTATAASRQALVDKITADTARLPRLSDNEVVVSDPNPHYLPNSNPTQPEHEGQGDVINAAAIHLKRSLESVMVAIITAARESQAAAGLSTASSKEPIEARWVHTTFPFTSPSYELEVRWNNSWLELLGCGVVKHNLLAAAGGPDRVSWAFGIGLERIAMVLFGIPDIRLFWSTNSRFQAQFADGRIKPFIPFSKYPSVKKDIAFWLPSSLSSAKVDLNVHDNDVMEIVRATAADLVEDVERVDEYRDKRSGKVSRCYRITYCALDRTLTTDEVLALHREIADRLESSLGVSIR